jgi:hypothetical protein
MSQGSRRGPQHGGRFGEGQGDGAPEPLVWERVTWRQGDGRYVFEVEEGGLHAKLSSPHGTSLILPMIAWEGLLDAIAGARKARRRNERAFPARSGARWYDGEAGELAAGFRAGRSIAQLARIHNRSAYAIELQLDRLGLWDRIAHRPVVPGEQRSASQAPLGEPAAGQGAELPPELEAELAAGWSPPAGRRE